MRRLRIGVVYGGRSSEHAVSLASAAAIFANLDRERYETYQDRMLPGFRAPYHWTTSEDGEHCYISWSGTDQMSVFSYESGQEVARLDVGDHPQRVREGRILENWLTP